MTFSDSSTPQFRTPVSPGRTSTPRLAVLRASRSDFDPARSGSRGQVWIHPGQLDREIPQPLRNPVVAARCWVGIFAEAVRDPELFARVRRLIDTELVAIERRAGAELPTHGAEAVLAFVVGALVVGAFAPKKAAGFAAPSMRQLLSAFGAS